MNEPAPADATDAELADVIGMKKAISATALAEEAKWTEEAKRRRKKEYIGQLFHVTVVRSTRSCLSTSAVVAKLGALWVRDHSKLVKYSQVRATAKQKAAA